MNDMPGEPAADPGIDVPVADVPVNDVPVIDIEALGVTLWQDERSLDGVTLSVAPGSVYALLGRNGAGKSSLVRCLLGHQKPDRGYVRLFRARGLASPDLP